MSLATNTTHSPLWWSGGFVGQDLAMLYGLGTRVLKQAVRRNKEHLSEDLCLNPVLKSKTV